AKTTATADALSTAILILGPIKGKQFIDKLPGIEGLIVTKNDVTLRSYGWGYYT
ncbi:MAG TPA: FAD:protein FMN transferase, partial [Candidatus Desulfofervidus auxilii]|nr:FAD:protein FMN transferase [Candidatus Desulfofervidus auxilii]